MFPRKLSWTVLTCLITLVAAGAAYAQSACLAPIDFELDAADDPLVAGDLVGGIPGLLGPGVTVSSHNEATKPAMIFDTACPGGCSGGDRDLGTPNQDFGGPGIGAGGGAGTDGQNALALGKVLIISEDGDSNDPDDNSGGGTLIFTFDHDVHVERVQVIDIDEGAAGQVTAYDAGGSVVLASAMLDNRGNNSVQTVQLGASGVRSLEIEFPGSGAVSQIVFCDESACIPDIDFETRADDPDQPLFAGDIIDGVAGALPQTVVASHNSCFPAMIFDSANPTGGDSDLGTPNLDFGGPGIGAGGGSGQAGENSAEHGNILIISEDGDSLDPDDRAAGGTLTFTFDDPTYVAGVEILDIDGNETCGTITTFDEGGVVITSQPLANLGDNSFQAVTVDVGAVKTMEVYFQGSGAVARVLSCDPDEPDCSPSGGNLKLSDGRKVVRLKLTNNGTDPVTLDSVDVTWAPIAGELRKIKLGSTLLFTGNVAPTSASVALTGPAGDRTLLPGESKMLKVVFQRGVDASEFHSLTANFAEAVDCATGDSKNDGEPLDDCDVHPSPELLELTPKNKQARGKLINGGGSPASISSITLNEWSAANGNLTKIKLGADTIWTGSLASAGAPHVLTAGDFTGPTALAVGQAKTLRLIFANDAQEGPYEVIVEFTAGGQTCDVAADQDGPPVETFTLTVDVTGNGTVSGSGIDCGADCTEDFTDGTLVSLAEAADAGWQFSGWGGDCDASGEVTMDANKTCTALFEELPPEEFTLTVVVTGSGTVTGPGISCGADCTEDYVDGTLVSMSEAASAGWAFAGWGGDCVPPGEVTMDADKTCTALFEEDAPPATCPCGVDPLTFTTDIDWSDDPFDSGFSSAGFLWNDGATGALNFNFPPPTCADGGADVTAWAIGDGMIMSQLLGDGTDNLVTVRATAGGYECSATQSFGGFPSTDGYLTITEAEASACRAALLAGCP